MRVPKADRRSLIKPVTCVGTAGAGILRCSPRSIAIDSHGYTDEELAADSLASPLAMRHATVTRGAP